MATIVVVAGLVATACMTPPPSDTSGGSLDLDLLNRPSLADADARVGHMAPTAAQIGEASGLGAAVR